MWADIVNPNWIRASSSALNPNMNTLYRASILDSRAIPSQMSRPLPLHHEIAIAQR
jgi:hypothetical protein